MSQPFQFEGAGLGLRRSIVAAIQEEIPVSVGFFEVAPENWIGVGGRLAKQLRQVSERVPLIAHGLSLSVGGTEPLDKDLIYNIKDFLTHHKSPLYSEHLSFSNHGGQLYDLLPLPFTAESVHHTAARIRQVQDMLERRIAVENVSYYLTPCKEMSEVEFIIAVLEEADCDLLLDVNNVYVNSVNHSYDALGFIEQMPAERIAYIHMAGHYVEEDGLIIDTHGAEVIDPVWSLLDKTYRMIGERPTLLERDFNLPSLGELLKEVDEIKRLQQVEEQRRGRTVITAV